MGEAAGGGIQVTGQLVAGGEELGAINAWKVGGVEKCTGLVKGLDVHGVPAISSGESGNNWAFVTWVRVDEGDCFASLAMTKRRWPAVAGGAGCRLRRAAGRGNLAPTARISASFQRIVIWLRSSGGEVYPSLRSDRLSPHQLEQICVPARHHLCSGAKAGALPCAPYGIRKRHVTAFCKQVEFECGSRRFRPDRYEDGK